MPTSSAVSLKDRRALLLLPLALVGVGLVIFHTRFGPGASGDSAFYLMGAENLLAGNGFARYSGGYELRPISGFPPAYPMFIAALGLVGESLVQVGRWGNAVLFAINLALIGYLLLRATGSTWAAAVGQLLLLVSPTQFGLHSWLMSEPLYTLFFLLGVLLTLHYVEGGSMRLGLVLGGVMAAAFLTRYVGASLIAASLLLVLLFLEEGFLRRLGKAVATGAVALVPIVVWFVRNARVAETLTNREFIYHPIRPELVRLYLAEVSSWFVPHEVPLPTEVRAGLAVLIAFGLTVLFVYIRAQRSAQGKVGGVSKQSNLLARIGPLPVVLYLYLAAYLGVLLVNSTFFDAATTASAATRYLAPVYVAVVILFVVQAYEVGWRYGGRVAQFGLAAVLIVNLSVMVWNTSALLSQPLEAMGYMGHRFDWPQVQQELSELDPGTLVISNNPELVYILTGRPAYARPIRFDVYQDQAREDFRAQVEGTRARLEQGGVYVVFRPIEPIDRDVVELTGAQLLHEMPQAVMYGYPSLREGSK